ncbi:MAG: hypothetical protein IT385_02620 [Deltaproteobacteria bacterium]|nr:hypothetical protein [Deltaproteobacteria bacterium]
MRARVTMRLDDGTLRELGPCDVIGRMWTAALQVSDPFVSEAHALVSLREGALKLLGLRGRLSVGGKPVPEVALAPGLRIGLSPRTTLEVVEVEVPSELLALDHPALGKRLLSGVVSIVTRPRLDVLPGARPDAAAVVWSDGLGWFARTGDGADQPLDEGATLTVDGQTFVAITVAVGSSGEITAVDPTQLDTPLHLVVRYDTVHVHRDGAPTLILDGMIARIVSDLATAGVPMGWQLLAKDLWEGEDDPAVLRRNWDAALARLRKKLREARVRADLVRADRSGNFEIFLRRGDRVDDQT